MDIKLTVPERIFDLRKEKKLNQEDVAEAIGISASTMNRFEKDGYTGITYQDMVRLAEFHDVSMDYLCGVTEHRKHRNVEIDALGLNDGAVELLKSKRANNRLISELLTLEDFIKLLSTIEIYIDNKLTAGTNSLNAVIHLAEKSIEKAVDLQDKDDILSTLREGFVDENTALRYRITERFNAVLLQLCDKHKDKADHEAEELIIGAMEPILDEYFAAQNGEEFKLLKISLKQLGVSIEDFTYEERVVLEKFLEKANKTGQFAGRSKGHYKKRKPMK